MVLSQWFPNICLKPALIFFHRGPVIQLKRLSCLPRLFPVCLSWVSKSDWRRLFAKWKPGHRRLAPTCLLECTQCTESRNVGNHCTARHSHGEPPRGSPLHASTEQLRADSDPHFGALYCKRPNYQTQSEFSWCGGFSSKEASKTGGPRATFQVRATLR